MANLRNFRISALQKVNDVTKHHRTDELADIMNELQDSSKTKWQTEGLGHTLKQTRPTHQISS